MSADLASRWPLDDLLDVRDDLLAAYADDRRSYHDTGHLTDVLDRLDELSAAGVAFDPVVVRLAAWFHDGVYDGAPDDEERSAAWALAVLPPAVGPDVARLVRMTATHTPTDPDEAALSDADLAILAAPRERYDAYATSVREEYAHVAEPDFRAGRAAILRDLLAKTHLFATEHARSKWEAAARANLSAELGRLSGS